MKKRLMSILLLLVVITFLITPMTYQAYAEDYRSWAQGDARWGSIRMGSSSYTIAQEGCAVTSVTKLIIQCGLRDSSSFNVGTLATWLNNNNGYQYPNALYWGKPSECVPGFNNYGDLVSLGSYSSSGNNDQIINWIRSGYHMAICVNGGGHWVAVDEAKSLSTGTVYIMDSLSSKQNTDITLASRYSTFVQIHAYTGGSTPSSKPTNVRITLNKDSFVLGEAVHITPSATGADKFTMRVCYEKYGDDTTVFSDFNGFTGTKVFTPSKAGTYIVRVSAINSAGYWTDAECTFIVKPEANMSLQNAKFINISTESKNFPDTIVRGNNVRFSGIINATDVITWAWAGVDSDTVWHEIQISKNPMSTAYQISELSAELNTGDLPVGKHTFSIQAICGDKYFTVYSKEFEVLEPSMRYSGEDFPEELIIGHNHNITGNISANGIITWVWMGVTDLETSSHVIETQANPCSLHYDIDQLSQQLDFSLLQTGNYKYTIEGICGDQYFVLYSRIFSVVEKCTEHAWDSGSVTKEPTETAEGVKTFTCTVCGETRTESIPKLAHTHKLTAVAKVAATCTKDGTEAYWKCDGCGKQFSDAQGKNEISAPVVIKATGHEWDSGKVTKAATCTEAGVQTFTCKHDSGHTRTETISALGHDYKAVITAPTCTEKGYTTHTCSCCGDSYVDSYVNALGHKTELQNAKAATCTADGYTGDEICSTCGETIRKGTVIKATGHKWDSGKVTKEPTETAEGVKTFTCTVCGETRTEAIPKLTHTHNYTEVVTPPTCTEQGYTTHTCAGCGESYEDSYVNALGHKTELRNAKAATCTVDGYTGDEICSVCGVTVKQGTVIKATGHKWDSGKVTKEPTETAEGVKTFTCTVCGETKTEAIPKLTPVTPPAPNNPFVDVKQGAYYYDPVLWAVNHQPQITNGTSATTFSPDATCTRGQVVTFLWRANGCPEPKSTSNPFKDVASGAYYYKAVLWAVENGITNGTSATTFSPDAPCTRAHVVTFLWRSANKPAAGSTNPFHDVAAGQYYTDAVLWAVSKNITNGTSATTFSPDNPCTRGQIVTFLYRYMGQT